MSSDKAVQIVRQVQEGERIEDKLPRQLWDPVGDRFMYPNSINAVYGDLRGQDAPRTSLLGVDKYTKADRPAPVKITFRGSSGGNVLFTAGSFRATQPGLEEGEINEARKVGVPVKLRWIMHSQLQGFVLQIDRSAAGDKSSEATVHFHVNNILAEEYGDKRSICFKHQKGPALAQTLDPKSGLSSKTQNGTTLWGMTVTPWCSGDRTDVFPGENAPPRFRGISPDEIEDIRKKGDAARRDDKLNDLSILSHGDWILFGLLVCHEFTMYRTWKADGDANDVYDYFTKYTSAVFMDILVNGNWPHYVRQAREQGKHLNDDDFYLGDTRPPRHMVKTWRVTYNSSGKPQHAEAETWNHFQPLTAYPDSSSKSVALKLGVERVRGRGDGGRGRGGSEAPPEPTLPRAPTLTPANNRFGLSIADTQGALRTRGARGKKGKRPTDESQGPNKRPDHGDAGGSGVQGGDTAAAGT